LNADCQFSNEQFYNKIPAGNDWLRGSAAFNIDAQEWNYWLMTQMIIRYYNSKGEVIKTNLVRPARLLSPGVEQLVHLDSEIPDEEFDYVGLLFWHASGDKNVQIRNVTMESF